MGRYKRTLPLASLMAAPTIFLGCAGFPSGSPYPRGTIIVNTEPQGAILTFEDKTQCTSPCAVPILSETTIKIAKAGYKAKTYVIRPAAQTQVTIPMALSAPTIGVEEAPLPDL